MIGKGQSTVEQSGLRSWLLALAALMAWSGPVLGSEGWEDWDSHRRALKMLNWGITGILFFAVMLVAVPRRMGFTSMLRALPWIALVTFLTVAGLTLAFSPLSPVSLARIAYAGITCAAWFAFQHRYPHLFRP